MQKATEGTTEDAIMSEESEGQANRKRKEKKEKQQKEREASNNTGDLLKSIETEMKVNED